MLTLQDYYHYLLQDKFPTHINNECITRGVHWTPGKIRSVLFKQPIVSPIKIINNTFVNNNNNDIRSLSLSLSFSQLSSLTIGQILC